MNTPQLQSLTLQEVSTTLGTCFGIVDDHEYAFLALASESYPRATLRGILCELKEAFYKNNPNAAEVLLDSHSVSGEFLTHLGKKYNKVQEVSRVVQAQDKVTEVQVQMEANIKHTLENQESMKVRARSNVGHRAEDGGNGGGVKAI